ncbi:hypothetical protein [Streptomyces carpinensis]|uniref:Uncharacterized protein n=1 Tax=Streptomyces carpinensis TaxID=66369 RepID=A0ABV1W481_9ACTN|nr:hypothetical protein [Streptomyces carpinensis]
MRWGAQPHWARWVAVVYVIGFLEGTGAHAYFAATGGIHAYRDWPMPSQLLFHSLLVLDALAAAWIALVRPAGPVLGAAVIAADLTANWWGNWAGVVRHPLDYLQPVGLTPITLFGLFVFATAAPLRRSFRRADRHESRSSPPHEQPADGRDARGDGPLTDIAEAEDELRGFGGV